MNLTTTLKFVPHWVRCERSVAAQNMRSSFEQKPMQHEFQCAGLPGLEGMESKHKGTLALTTMLVKTPTTASTQMTATNKIERNANADVIPGE